MSTTHNKTTANVTQTTDPTGTYGIRQSFLQAIRSRFRKLRGLIRQTVGYENNALHLKEEDRQPLIAQAEPQEEFQFTTNPQRIAAFMAWVNNAIEEEILEPLSISEDVAEHWTSAYIREGYLTGFNHATGLLFQQGLSVDNPTRDTILARPITQTELQTLYTRTYENLNEITEDMAQVIREELTEGLAKGENPRKMADRITKEIRDIEKTRAETLARTEVINAHTESALNRFENNGVTTVRHTTWKTAEDSRVCPFCERLNGVTLTTEEMREGSVSWSVEPDWSNQVWRLAPPAHPSCRCSVGPELGAEVETPLGERLSEIDGFERATVQT